MAFNRTILLLTALSLPVTLASCKTAETAFDNNCKVGGAAIGAVLGGIAGGLLLGKGGGKAGTALLGAAVGGLLGQQIGSLLDCQDKQALATASQTAGEAPVGQKIMWASNNANVPPQVAAAPAASPPPAAPAAVSDQPAPAAKPVKKKSQPKLTDQRNQAAPPQPGQGSNQWAAVEPAANGTGASSGQWAAVEPIRSGGQSGMWGWVEPVSPSTTSADGRTCRVLKQVVVEPNGQQHEETVTSCLNDQKQWIIASR